MQIKIGKDLTFYNLLEDQAKVALKASEAFRKLAGDFPNLADHARALAVIEQEGDELTHRLQNAIATTFITPLDKEDLRDLSQALDDIVDYIEAAAARAELYRLTEARPDLPRLAQLLNQAAAAVLDAVGEMRNGFGRSATLRHRLQQIHEIENESDVHFRTALGTLFSEPPDDLLMVIKWKEIYDRVETAIDACEDVAKIIGTVLVKYA